MPHPKNPPCTAAERIIVVLIGSKTLKNTFPPSPLKRIRVPFLEFSGDLSLSGFTAEQLVLIFGFEAVGSGRVLVYTDAGLISDQTLASTDNQFLLEIDLPATLFNLYFIHAGGEWFFRGLSGYVV